MSTRWVEGAQRRGLLVQQILLLGQIGWRVRQNKVEGVV